MEINIFRWLVFILVLVRMTAFLAASPLFSLRNIPATVKVGLGLVLTLVIFPQAEGGGLTFSGGLLELAGLVICETMTGIVAGMAASFLFAALRVGGQLLDIHVGFAAAQLFDPLSSESNTLLGHFFHILGLVLLFSLDAHHQLITGLLKSFQLVSLGSLLFSEDIVKELLQVFLLMMEYGLRIALPVMIVLFVFDLVLGFISKAVPQFNILMVGFPLKICIGILVTALTIPVLGTVVCSLFEIMEKEVSLLFGFR
ncbi:MAG: flagellar biosynthetic protein FliR [Bacillota bacterium]|jgi:flagellar biosynthetic protein FliR|nr:flagellar biosynthetic protein FliR [Clostridia bacterium]